MYELVIVIPIIRTDFIEKCLETLYQMTDPKLFRVIVVDQTPNGVYEKIKDKVHFYIRPNRNLGFAKAANEGIIHAHRWGVPYIAVLNDDTELMPTPPQEGAVRPPPAPEVRRCRSSPRPREPLWG